MAGKLSSNQKKEELNKLFAKYNVRIGMLYSNFVKKLLSLGYDESVLESDALFNFDNFPELKIKLNNIFNDYFQSSLLCYESGITDGVTLAYNHDKKDLGAFTILSNDALKVARETAAKTFISNRLHSKDGLNLSQMVWNYCQQSKSEFEMAMSNVIADGITAGESAVKISSQLRQYLNNPDMMYRRYHAVKRLKNGTKKDVVKWYKRKIINGKIRFVNEPLEAVGVGVYRSARKNALRVARTEINAAYLKAHNERWRKEPFVTGQWIHVSPQHDPEKDYDICDELQGRYPKDFVWLNWHPQCRCTSDPITLQGDEKKQFYKRLMAGEDMSNYVSPLAVTDVPDEFKQYIRDNEESIIKAYKNDKLAWHLAYNKQYWQKLCSDENKKLMGVEVLSRKERILQAAKERHAQRTQEQIDKIQRQWTLRRSANYMERMNDELDSLKKYEPSYRLGGALSQRYKDVLSLVKNKASVENVEKVLNRFNDGIKIKEQVFQRLAPLVLREQKLIFKERFKSFKSDSSIYQGDFKLLYDKFIKSKDGYEARIILDNLRNVSLKMTKDALVQQGIVDGLQYIGNTKDYVISKARTLENKGKSIDIKGYTSDFVCFKDKAGIKYYYETFGYGDLAKFNAKEMSEFLLNCPKYVQDNIKGIISCNQYHPLDAYYKKVYKNFGHGYMYSSNPVTVHSTAPRDYEKFSIIHEIGHHVDYKLNSVSAQKEWEQAILLDKGYITEYAKQAPVEDFAETFSYYAQGGGYKKYVERNFPNRAKLLEKLLSSL